MKDLEATLMPTKYDSPIMQNGIPIRMSLACTLSCILGIILMAATGHHLLMWAFVCILACSLISAALFAAKKISIEMACLAPMLLLCFGYTPLSWFTFGGLQGPTPYLSILFSTLITLTYYRKIQVVLHSLYGLFMLGLTAHWLATNAFEGDIIQIINIAAAYILSATLTLHMAEEIKRKNHEMNRRVVELSMRDDLTGLFNRRVTEQVINSAEQLYRDEAAEYAVVILDIDNFKSINDRYGHNLGDSALKSFAMCIQENVRSADYAFRIGGDEFMLVLPNVNRANVSQICTRIEAALSGINGFSFPVRASIGCGLRSEASSSDALLELADQRMYAAKRDQGIITHINREIRFNANGKR